jgi:hypothetical protein
MKRNLLVLAIAVSGSLVLNQAPARGQFGPGIGQPYLPPPVSPYINLLRGGSSTFLNYYGIVRPQFAFQNAIGTLNQEVTANQAAITTGLGGNPGVLYTGHSAVFLNTSGYFLTNTAGRVVGGQGGAPIGATSVIGRGVPAGVGGGITPGGLPTTGGSVAPVNRGTPLGR